MDVRATAWACAAFELTSIAAGLLPGVISMLSRCGDSSARLLCCALLPGGECMGR